MQDQLINRLKNEVLSLITDRLCADRRVSRLTVFSDMHIDYLKRISRKVHILENNGDLNDNPSNVISDFLTCNDHDDAVFVFYNPLFPFVSLNSISYAYTSVINKSAKSAIGSYYPLKETIVSIEDALEHDNGIFSVIDKDEFNKSNSRVSDRTRIVGLTALELICLRTEADLDLYNLVVNSGMM